ncbi:MAG: GTP-binding protein [Bacteroidetes Order II. Incertae sedis bacterium]|nr:GTP-binding protein [Bacteroidetes Order II. bacterium]
MLGSFAVGKTSLVKRFVNSIFSEEYLTTVGVKVDKRLVKLNETEVNLMLWDLHGEDEFQKLRLSYLRGMSGYILVVDGTRKITLDRALALQRNTEATFGPVPFILVLNKADLAGEWQLSEEQIEGLLSQGWLIKKTSALTGEAVVEIFELLTERMLQETS